MDFKEQETENFVPRWH